MVLLAQLIRNQQSIRDYAVHVAVTFFIIGVGVGIGVSVFVFVLCHL